MTDGGRRDRRRAPVTALYEIVPRRGRVSGVDPLKYQRRRHWWTALAVIQRAGHREGPLQGARRRHEPADHQGDAQRE